MDYVPSKLETATIDVWKESVDAASSSAVGFLISLFYTILLVRILPQVEVGLFFFYLAVVFLFIQITKGIGAAVRKRVSSTDDIELRQEYLWSSFSILVPVLSAISLGLFTFAYFIAPYSPIEISTTGVLVVIITTIAVSVMEISRFYLSGTGSPGLAERYRVFIGKGSMILLIILVYLYPSAELALLLRGLSFLLSGFVMLCYSPCNFTSPTKDRIFEILHFSKWSIPTHLLNDFYHRWDTLLLGVMVGAVSISHYDSSVRLATVGFPLMLGISTAANVKLSGLYESNEPFNKTFEKLLTATSLVAYPVLLVFFFSGELILEILYGPEYVAAAGMLLGIAVQQVFQGYRFQFEALFNSCDVPHKTTKTSALSVLVNLITAPFLVLEFGAIGVIYSTLLAEVVRIATYEYQAYLHTNEVFLHKALLLQPALLIILGLILQVIHMMADLTGYTTLACSIIAVGMFYILLYVLSEQTRTILSEAKQEVIG